MPTQTLTFVFATERGTPEALTEHRCKAAVPFGGKYRVIDFTLANCLHSGLRRILVLTQYKSHSLHKHLRDAWSLFTAELGEFITPVPPQMRDGSGWYAGPVDALRQNRYLIQRSPADTLLLLDAGAVYRMDYGELVRFHRENGAWLTCALREAGGAQAGVASPGRVAVELTPDERIHALTPVPPPGHEGGPLSGFLAPMGVVVIDKALLLSELDRFAALANPDQELATQLLSALFLNPAARIFAYRFGGVRGRVRPDRYWSDLGSTDAYFRAHMDLLRADPPLDLYQPDWNIMTYQGQFPPARTVPGEHSGNEGIFVNSMLASGTVVRGGGVSHSVLYPQVEVQDGAIVDEAILFEGVKVGAGAQLRRVICDKDVVIPPGTQIGFDWRADAERFEVSPGGIAVLRKGRVL